MAEWSLVKDHDGAWHEYLLIHGDQPVAFAKWVAHGSDAEIHNDIFRSSKSVVRKVREIFETAVKPDMKQHGITRIVVMSDRHNPTMEHYWRMMGFEFHGTYADGTHTVPYAVMEV